MNNEFDGKNAGTDVVQVVDYVIERECELTQVKERNGRMKTYLEKNILVERNFPPLDILQHNSSWPITEPDLPQQG